MITTGRTTVNRELEELLNSSLQEIFATVCTWALQIAFFSDGLLYPILFFIVRRNVETGWLSVIFGGSFRIWSMLQQ